MGSVGGAKCEVVAEKQKPSKSSQYLGYMMIYACGLRWFKYQQTNKQANKQTNKQRVMMLLTPVGKNNKHPFFQWAVLSEQRYPWKTSGLNHVIHVECRTHEIPRLRTIKKKRASDVTGSKLPVLGMVISPLIGILIMGI